MGFPQPIPSCKCDKARHPGGEASCQRCGPKPSPMSKRLVVCSAAAPLPGSARSAPPLFVNTRLSDSPSLGRRSRLVPPTFAPRAVRRPYPPLTPADRHRTLAGSLCVREWNRLAFALVIEPAEVPFAHIDGEIQRLACFDVREGAFRWGSERCRSLGIMRDLLADGSLASRVFALARQARARLVDDGWRRAALSVSYPFNFVPISPNSRPVVIMEENIPLRPDTAVLIQTQGGYTIRHRVRSGESVGDLLRVADYDMAPLHRGAFTIPLHIRQNLVTDPAGRDWAAGLYEASTCTVVVKTAFLKGRSNFLLCLLAHEFFHSIFRVHSPVVLDEGSSWIEEAVCEAVAVRVMAESIRDRLAGVALQAETDVDQLFGEATRGAWGVANQVRDWSRALSAGSNQLTSEDGSIPYQTGRLFYHVDNGRLAWLRPFVEALEEQSNDPHGYRMLDRAFSATIGRELRGVYEDAVFFYTLKPEYRAFLNTLTTEPNRLYWVGSQGLGVHSFDGAGHPLRALPPLSTARLQWRTPPGERSSVSFSPRVYLPVENPDGGLFTEPLFLRLVVWGVGELTLNLEQVPGPGFNPGAIYVEGGTMVEVFVMNLNYEGRSQPWVLDFYQGLS